MSSSPRTIVLEPAAALEYQRLAGKMPDFEEAWDALTAVLCRNPRRGWPIGGGRWAYALASRGKPRVRATFTFDEARIRMIDIQTTPVEHLPSSE